MNLSTSRIRDSDLDTPDTYHIREDLDYEGQVFYLCLFDAPNGSLMGNAGKPITDKVLLEFEAPTWEDAQVRYNEFLKDYYETSDH